MMYPNHDRVPNVVVRGLYHVGYFIGDFVPMFLNMIDGMYWSIKRLVAFIVGLLVDSSIFIVVISSIAFSVGHSIELLREVGAENGREYFGVAMFEVIYLGSSATLTRFLMKKRKPVGFVGWMGLLFTLLGFLIGLGFVWWSNVHGLAPTTEGFVVGSLVPVLVLVCEGILAFRYMSEIQDDTTGANTSTTNNTNNRTDNHDNSDHRHNINTNVMIANNNVNDDNSDQRQQGKTDKDNKATNTADKSDNDNASVRNALQRQQHSNNDDNNDSNNNDNDRRSMNVNNGDNNVSNDNQHGRNTTNANHNDNNNHNHNSCDNTTAGANNKHNNTDNKNDATNKVVNMSERKRKKRRELDPDTVLAIFQAKGSNAHIGRKFGVSAETVRKIKLGERHADVTAPYRQRQAK